MTGGYNSKDGLLNSTEVFNTGKNQFVSCEDLPVERNFHSLVAINSSSVIMFSGQGKFNETFVFNKGTWLTGPPLLKGRAFTQAGYAIDRNGKKAIIATGIHIWLLI